MKKEAQRRSLVMMDQPQRPEDIAVYWLEYVIRHHGAPHLVSPVRSMPWLVMMKSLLLIYILILLDHSYLDKIYNHTPNILNKSQQEG